MDLVYKDSLHNDLGVLHNYSCDYDVADTMDFQIDVGIENTSLKGGYYWFIEGTEYGGKIDKYTVLTESSEIRYYGRNIRGLLESKVIQPPQGQDYLIKSGNVSDIISDLIDDTGYRNLYTVEPCDYSVTNYKFSRYVTTYSGINALCRICGLVPTFIFDVEGICHISFSKPTDYTDENEYTPSDLNFVIEKGYAGVNHLICLGQGDLKDRTVIHLFVNSQGNITDTQYYYGDEEIAQVYDYPNAEDAETLRTEGIQKLQELMSSDNFTVTVTNSSDLKLGDIVGGVERNTDTYVRAEITNIIAAIQEDNIEVSYVAGGDNTNSGASSSSRSSAESYMGLNDSVQVAVTQVVNVYNQVTQVTQVVYEVQKTVEELEATMITTETLRADVANINDLTANDAIIKNIFSESIISDEAIIDVLQTNIITTDVINAIEATVEEAVIGTLSTTYLKADFANLNTAIIDNAKIQDLLVASAWIEKATVGEEYAFKLVGDVIKANTMALEELIFVDDLGNPTKNLVYHINDLTGGLDKEHYTDEQLSAKLNGKDIIANSITAEQINVRDLFAQDITATGTITGARLNGSWVDVIGGNIGVFQVTSTGLLADYNDLVTVDFVATTNNCWLDLYHYNSNNKLIEKSHLSRGFLHQEYDENGKVQYQTNVRGSEGSLGSYTDENGNSVYALHYLADTEPIVEIRNLRVTRTLDVDSIQPNINASGDIGSNYYGRFNSLYIKDINFKANNDNEKLGLNINKGSYNNVIANIGSTYFRFDDSYINNMYASNIKLTSNAITNNAYNSYIGNISCIELTQNQDYKLPNKSGTLALLEDIKGSGIVEITQADYDALEDKTGSYFIIDAEDGLTVAEVNAKLSNYSPLAGSSSLTTCSKGTFGDIVTKNISDFVSSSNGVAPSATKLNFFRGNYQWVPEQGFSVHMYEGQSTAAYGIPHPYCIVFSVNVQAVRGVAYAISWDGGSQMMWINSLHDDSGRNGWHGWKRIV